MPYEKCELCGTVGCELHHTGKHEIEAEAEEEDQEPIIPGPATPLERGAGAMETTPEEWAEGVKALRQEQTVTAELPEPFNEILED